MLEKYTCLVLLLVLSIPGLAQSADSFQWPDGKQTAISLSYDDALHSQLDHAIPALDRHNFKASFYLTLSSAVVRNRMAEWRAAAANGHELGNHTINHPCRASKPNREWVTRERDLDQFSVAYMRNEVATANTFLHAIDGKTERTFTPPCLDRLAGGEDYVAEVESLFVSVKGLEEPEEMAVLWSPSEVTGEELIQYVKEQGKSKKLINLLFHGVGGDYLAVTNEAHDALLQYLAENQEIYWVDTYINIMQSVKE